MKKSGRYDTSGLVEAQFEPGSRRRVLRNSVGIKSARKMDDAEAAALGAAMDVFVIGLQAGLPPLDFSLIAGPARKAYFAAIQSGMDRNYQPMEKLFDEIIDRSLAA
jgi:hypothetical protein